MTTPYKDITDACVFELNGNTYQIRPLNVFNQLKIVSKLSPVLTLLVAQEDKNIVKEKFAELLAIFSNNLPEDQFNEVLKLCLGSVHRRIKNAWHPIYRSNDIVYQDIALKDMLNIIYEVMEANKLFDFFSTSQLKQETETN